MDFSRRSNLTKEENFRIASIMHAVLLDEFFRATQWKLGDAVFHGGTSLHMGHNSTRWSEDLDFMVNEDRWAGIMAAAPKVAERLRLRMSALVADSVIEMKVKTGKPGADRIDTWDIRWSHPNRMGKVIVKMEFYQVLRHLLPSYGAKMIVPVGQGGVRVTTPVPIAEIASLWADKVKAIATRVEFKWRDAHDLAFVADRLEFSGKMPEPDMLQSMLRHVAEIYSVTTRDIVDGLERRLSEGCFADYAAFRTDMARWFSGDTAAHLAASGTFDQMLDTARAEVERGHRILSADAQLAPARRILA